MTTRIDRQKLASYRDDFPKLDGNDWEEAMDAAGHNVTSHISETGECGACDEPLAVHVLANTKVANVILNKRAARALLDKLRGGDLEPDALMLVSELMGQLTDLLEPETCPNCKQTIWDNANQDQALSKCWNCGTRFM